MLTQTSEIEMIEVARSGVLQVRIKIKVCNDGVPISFRNHRTVIEPGVDPREQIAMVNVHLVQMGSEIVTDAKCERLYAVAAAVHTPETIAEYAEARDKADAIPDTQRMAGIS